MIWTEVRDGITVPARPQGIWTLVFDYVRGPALVKVEAKDTWRYSTSREGGVPLMVEKRGRGLPMADPRRRG